jgi:hypothetical protein
MLNLKKIVNLRSKNLILVCIGIVGILFLIWLLSSPQPHFRSFVSNTQQHIKNINSKLEILEDEDGDSIFSKEENKDSTYLELLGFVKEPTLFESKKNELANNRDGKSEIPRIPPLVTAFKRFGDKEKALIESKMKFFMSELILIYDLDLSSSEQLVVSFAEI